MIFGCSRPRTPAVIERRTFGATRVAALHGGADLRHPLKRMRDTYLLARGTEVRPHRQSSHRGTGLGGRCRPARCTIELADEASADDGSRGVEAAGELVHSVPSRGAERVGEEGRSAPSTGWLDSAFPDREPVHKHRITFTWNCKMHRWISAAKITDKCGRPLRQPRQSPGMSSSSSCSDDALVSIDIPLKRSPSAD